MTDAQFRALMLAIAAIALVRSGWRCIQEAIDG